MSTLKRCVSHVLLHFEVLHLLLGQQEAFQFACWHESFTPDIMLTPSLQFSASKLTLNSLREDTWAYL